MPSRSFSSVEGLLNMEALGPKAVPGLAEVPSPRVAEDIVALLNVTFFLFPGGNVVLFFFALDANLSFLVGVMSGSSSWRCFLPIAAPVVFEVDLVVGAHVL